MRKLTLLIALFFTVGQSWSQEEVNNSENTPKHAVGMHAGFTTGVGLSYRFWPKKLGIQLTGLPFFNSKNNKTTVFMGASIMYKMVEARRIDLFTYLGNQYSYRSHTESRHNVGLGFGMNIHNWLDKMYFTFQGGYAIYDIRNEPFSFLTGEIGVYFRF